uniref:Uncharacterized protein n=1 Tax=Sus scrofa TaxID=9823 RepID=A0A8D1BG63_PIG
NFENVLVFCLVELRRSASHEIEITPRIRCTSLGRSDSPLGPRSLESAQIIPSSQNSCPFLERTEFIKVDGQKDVVNPEIKALKNVIYTLKKKKSLSSPNTTLPS